MSNIKVFCYGILKQGRGGHEYLSKAIKLGTTTTPPEYTMYSLGGFPGVTEGGTTGIIGEVYEINETILARLDILEGWPDFYNRKKITTDYGEAWMYYIENRKFGNHISIVESGEW